MTEQFILGYVPQRVKQLGYTNYHVRYRDLIVEGDSTLLISAYNELFFIVDDPRGITIDSDYGVYDSTDDPLSENIHQHRGEIAIVNRESESKRVKFIQVIIVN